MLRVANGLDNAAQDGTGADAKNISAADAIKKFTPSLGIPYLGVRSKIWEPLVTPKSGLLNF